MGFSCGLIGLPNAGKTTLFNAITGARAATAPYPFTTIEPHAGRATVPDDRLFRLASLVRPERVVPASIEVVDIAGLVKGASKGEGLGNRFLGHIREVDALIHVVRCHLDPDIPHDGEMDPALDAEIVDLELMMADMETIDRRYERIEKAARYGEKKEQMEAALLKRLRSSLEKGVPVRLTNMTEDEAKMCSGLFLLTAKPMVYVANVSEERRPAETDPLVERLEAYAARQGARVLTASARVEAEVMELPEEERAAFLSELGIPEPGYQRIISFGYRLLDLITFYTFNEKEARAWTVRRGTRAPQAAGRIHTDMEKGFIKAEVVRFNDLERAGSFQAARDAGLIRMEGKDYIVQDGDVIYFRFA